MIRTCTKHGQTNHYRRRPGEDSWRCGKCSGEEVSARRRRMKAILVEEAGGACIRCGYNKSLAALQFHHRDPAEKDHGLGFGNSVGIDRLRAEAAKCDLLCANCHAEVEEEIRLARVDLNHRPLG